MSAASHLRLPIEGSVVPDSAYSIPAEKERGTRRNKRTARAEKRYPVTWMGPMLALGLCASVCLLVSVGLVAQKAKLMSLGYELNGLQAELQSLEKERAQLQLALVTARSPKQIEQKAIAQLGMVKPGNVEYLFLEGASGSKAEISVADNTEHQVGPVAVVGSWFAENWPRWGRAEASSR